MSSLFSDQIIQLGTWSLVVVEFILALYILVLNVRHTANRHVSFLLLVFAINSLTTGASTAFMPEDYRSLITILLVITTPTMGPGLLIIAIVLLKPQWLAGRWRWVWWPVYALLILPTVLTLIDVALGTHLWFTGIDLTAPPPAPGSLLTTYTAGPLATAVRVLGLYAMPIVTSLILLVIALRDRSITRLTRRLAWLLLSAQVVVMGIQFGLRSVLGADVYALAAAAVFVLAYAYAAFQQMISERRAQWGRLSVRLTALMLVVTAPILLALVGFVSLRTETLIRQDADSRLNITNQTLATSVGSWLNLNVAALQQMVLLPEIQGMDPAQQTPIMQAMATAYPHMYLVSTTNLNGINVARNDAEAPKDYSDRDWFRAARAGAPVTYQTLIGRTSGTPALVVSMPIRNPAGDIVGVGMFASELTDISQQVYLRGLGATGITYVIDAQNQVVAHPDPAYATGELVNLSDYAPVLALRQGRQGRQDFVAETRWWAYVSQLDNGWGVITQQQEAELLEPLWQFQTLTWVMLGLSAIMLLTLAALAIRQALRPIGTLTTMAAAVASGDLTHTAPVESEDEFGMLARTFNSMTKQLRTLISGLEQRVSERTQDLERRSIQLEAAAQVAREATAIHAVDELLDATVRLISEQFGYYHAGIFLLAQREAGAYAVLRAASSPGGQRMLARDHRLKVGETSIVGYVAQTGAPRMAQDVGGDTAFYANPDLPQTRSEMAVPLSVRGRVVGVLDVQSTVTSAFTDQDVQVLQTLGDQIALAIENARLLAESQRALAELETLYGRQVRESWLERATRQQLAYRYTGIGVEPVAEHAAAWPRTTQQELSTPIQLRGQTIGLLALRREPDAAPWSPDDAATLQEVSIQISLALENARLLEETRASAEQEQLLNQLTARFTQSLDMDALLRAAVRELGQLPHVSEVSIYTGAPRPAVPVPPGESQENRG